MSNYSLLKRFAIIVDKINNKRPPSLKELLESLRQQGFDVSSRTLQRDIERLRDDFDLNIYYDVPSDTYRIDVADSLYFETLLRIIQLFNTSDILLKSVQENKKTLSFISFEQNIENDASTYYLETVFNAIHHCQVISFEHEHYEKKRTSRHVIKPLLLKEYSNKWYVVGAFVDNNSIRIFGLDRIKNLEVEKTKFPAKERNAVTHLFDHTIGLVYDMKKAETVHLSVTAGQAKYFKNVPLHHSQQIVAEHADEVVFSYFLTPNRELQRLILGYGTQVKVLKPAWFAQQVEDEIKMMLRKYKNERVRHGLS
jgi:predicted DNA-binding transcriptional regulator YafY